jgi:uncharacterized protein YhjY with autotransporter beta-barrel domain
MRSCGAFRQATFGTVLLLAAKLCCGQTTPSPEVPSPSVEGSLVELVNSGQYAFNTLERLSAIANQASYNALTSNPAGAIYCNPQQAAASPTCPAGVFLTFNNLRELVQTANALLGNGLATRFSLNLTDQGLGFALRWTAAEELSAPGTVATQFANAQVANLISRINALRFGASGFSLGGIQMQQNGGPVLTAGAPRALGGGASADSADIGIASRWGGFLNGSFGWGERAPTVLEDAFAFDSRDATLGADYRFTRQFVLGAAAGYSNQRIDFNSTESVVGGGIRSNGYSIQIYGLYEWEGPYISMSIGTQRADFTTTRLITYPSNNIAEPSINATANGSTHSQSLISTFNAGWPLIRNAFVFEPYLSAQYQNIDLAGFRESSVNNSGPAAGKAAGFDFDYPAQRITSIDAALGARFQYVLRPSFGVVLPFAKAEYHHRFDDSPPAVVSTYNAIANSGAEFDIPSDRPDADFYQFAGGISVVLKHGVQGFVQYQSGAGMTYVSSHLISGGIRGEF